MENNIKLYFIRLLLLIMFHAFGVACSKAGFTDESLNRKKQTSNKTEQNAEASNPIDNEPDVKVEVTNNIEKITIMPKDSTLVVGETLKYTVIGTFEDQSEKDISDEVEWMSTDTNVADFNKEESGLLKGVTIGKVDIIVKSGEIEAKTSVEIINPNLISIRIDPTDVSINIGQEKEFRVFASFEGRDTEENVSDSVEWEIEAPNVIVQGEKNNFFKGESVGSTKLIAKFKDKSSSAKITILEESKPEEEPPTVEEVETVDDVIKHCQEGNKELLKETIHFPPTAGCRYGEDGNLPKQAEINTAIGVQSQIVNIPTNTVVCNIDIMSRSEEFRYDDFMVLTLNDKALVISNKSLMCQFYPFSGCLDQDPNGLYTWDFSKIVGGPHIHDGSDSNNPFYCYGIGLAGTQCDLPGHDKRGSINYKLDIFSFAPLALSIKDRQEIKFDLIISGDNDTDCEHTDLKLDLEIEYSSLLPSGTSN